jgi:hypothetical protein
MQHSFSRSMRWEVSVVPGRYQYIEDLLILGLAL